MSVVVSNQTRLDTSPETLLQNALDLFEKELTDEQKNTRSQNNHFSNEPDLIVFIAEIAAANQSRRQNVAPRLTTFLENTHQFVSVIDTFVSSNPAIAALVWGGVKTSLLIATNNVDYLDKVTNMIAEIGRLSPTYAQFGRLYENDAQVRSMLCDYYAVVVRICTKIVRLCNYSRFNIGRLTSSFELDFQPLLDELSRARKRFNDQLQLRSQQLMHGLVRMTTEERNANRQHRLMSSRFRSSATRKQVQLSKMAADWYRREILDNLSRIRTRQIWSGIQAKRVTGTAEWVLEEPSFKYWRQSVQTSVLCCSGTLGTGKSVLASNIVAHLEQTRGVNDYISYHFCCTGNAETLTARGVLGTITRQLLASFLRELTHDRLQKLLSESEDISIYDMVDLLQRHLEPYREGSYFVLLDGIDECAEAEIDVILSQLKRLVDDHQLCVKLLCSCRPDLESVVCRHLKFDARLVLTKDNLQSDIKKYIDVTLHQCIEEEKLQTRDTVVLLRIASVLEAECHGMLLWLSLFIGELCILNNDSAILDALQHPPKGIKELYDRKLVRIRAHELSKDSLDILRYVGVAQRPLEKEEMEEVLSVSLDQKEFDPSKLPNNIDRVLRACSGLICVDEGSKTLQYVHSSLHSHLFATPDEKTASFDDTESKLHFSSLCMTYLNFQNFTGQINLTPKANGEFKPLDTVIAQVMPRRRISSKIARFILGQRNALTSFDMQQLHDLIQKEAEHEDFGFKFLSYTREYWLQHTKDLHPAKKSGFWNLLHRCVINPSLDQWKPWMGASQSHLDSTGSADEITQWAISNKHHALVLNRLLCKAADISDDAFQRITCYIEGHDDKPFPGAVQQFLKTGNLSLFLSQILMFFVPNGDDGCVQTLAAAGADINAAGSSGQTPLHYTTLDEQTETVQALLAAGADVNTTDSNGQTLLYRAALYGRTETVQALLAAGANTNTADSSGRTILHYAASNGQTETLQALLAAGVDVNTADSSGRTILHYAALYGRTETVQALLMAGADVNATDRKGDIPEDVVSRWEKSSIIALLRQHRSERNLTEESNSLNRQQQ